MNRLPWPLVFPVLGVLAAVWLVVQTWPIWILAFTAVIVAAAILPAARLGEWDESCYGWCRPPIGGASSG